VAAPWAGGQGNCTAEPASGWNHFPVAGGGPTLGPIHFAPSSVIRSCRNYVCSGGTERPKETSLDLVLNGSLFRVPQTSRIRHTDHLWPRRHANRGSSRRFRSRFVSLGEGMLSVMPKRPDSCCGRCAGGDVSRETRRDPHLCNECPAASCKVIPFQLPDQRHVVRSDSSWETPSA
jgi:hypothetical protein